MPLGTSFSTSGATPSYGGLFQSKPNPLGGLATPASTPFGKALSTAGSTPQVSPSTGPKFSPYVAPKTAVKKQTTTDAMGNTHITEYHAPEKTAGLLPPANKAKPVDVNNPNGETPEQMQTRIKSIEDATNARLSQGTPISFPGLVSGLANSTNRNAQIGQQAEDIASTAGEKIADIGTQGAKAQAGYLTTGTSPVAEGNAAVIANTTANQQKAVAEGAQTGLLGTQQALGAQGQTQSGLGTAAGLISPQSGATFFGSPLTGGLVGGGNNLMQNAVSQAVQLVQNGASPSDPAVTSLLSPFGTLGTQAFTTAMQQSNGGTYNPTVQGAIAGQNANQAVNYQQAATDLDTSLKQLDSASTLATNFLNSEKLLNPTDNPDYNAGINTYVGKFKNPADRLAYNSILGDIKKFTSTILASNNGSIPTDVTNTLNSFDPSTLSAPQLVPYLQTLSQLGGNQLSILQDQATKSKNGGTTGYKGTPTTINTTPITGPQETSTGGSQINNTTGQAIIGTAMNVWGGIEKVFSKLFEAI